MTDQEKLEALQRVTGGVSRETGTQLLELEVLFLRWARTMNLASPQTLGQTWSRHILDSAQLWVHRHDAQHWLDLGSGSGFPGLVLAVLAREVGHSVVMVESNQKKSAYLRQAIRVLHLPAEVQATRVESLPGKIWETTALVVTARAFAPLVRIFDWTDGFGGGAARALLHKGRGYQNEVAEARDGWTFDLLEHPSSTDADGVVLDVTGVRRTETQLGN
ncbi:MAG TPA: 16S rRNA (guanine(527)-N(7))-methyltransferase RsmG [Tianweitania sediminis]|nr:16S rRNA (guanine(527)-N(7))-methyltransferase RsmG [Tianweitania sediminis]